MSVAAEIQRIEQGKQGIVTAIKEKGATVQASAKIGDLADVIRGLETTPDGLSEILKDATGVS